MDSSEKGLPMLETIFAAFGKLIVAGGGGATIAVVIIRTFADRWLRAEFDKRLEAYKHEQQKELEQLRFKINGLLDRATKLHQREFEVLPLAWAHLSDANGEVLTLISVAQSYPDINRMSGTQLEELIEKSPFSAHEKQELLASDDKYEAYITISDRHRMSNVRKKVHEFHLYVSTNGIFIEPRIKAKFTELDLLIWNALSEYSININMQHQPREIEHANILQTRGLAIFKDLEKDVQDRLWNSAKLEI